MDSWMNVTPGSLNIQRAQSPTPTVRGGRENRSVPLAPSSGASMDGPEPGQGSRGLAAYLDWRAGGERRRRCWRHPYRNCRSRYLSGRETREEGRRPGGARREQPPSFDPVFIGTGRLHGRFRPGRPGPNRRIFPCVQVGWVPFRYVTGEGTRSAEYFRGEARS
jgi:hypothetical protein